MRFWPAGCLLPSVFQRTVPDHAESSQRNLRRDSGCDCHPEFSARSGGRFRLLHSYRGEYRAECVENCPDKGRDQRGKRAESSAEKLGITAEDKYEKAEKVAKAVLDDLHKPEYEKMELVEKLAYGPRFQRWQELGILPGGAKGEVFHGVVKCSTNLNSDPVDMLTDCLKLGISTGLYGLTLTNLLNDVLLGEPELRMAPVGLRVVDPDYINIMITGHQHTIFVDLQERLRSPEAVAKAQAAGAKGFRLVGCTCVGQDLQLRGVHYADIFEGHAGNNYTSEAGTGYRRH